ncbi:MAG: hypothetical protein HY808_14550 [Nitrospirae bacterium]|nr:hypothetical protein [Nitrospirota bacterium]
MKIQLVLSHIKTKSLPFFIGALAGYAVFHPYTMLVYSLTGFAHSGMHLKDVFFSFEREMLPMGVAFAVLGGLIGILIAVVIEKQRQLYTVTFENEKKKIALETLQQLMITLSHYLLNANMVIGGMVRRCQRIQTNEDAQHSLEAIAEQAKKIDAVISALKRLTEIKTAKYTAEGHALMIDISKEIEELLAGDSAKKE